VLKWNLDYYFSSQQNLLKLNFVTEISNLYKDDKNEDKKIHLNPRFRKADPRHPCAIKKRHETISLTAFSSQKNK
ncbi:hypothetical protein, partial [Flavobacterium collinsii]|uniref:hypothetical protein n=1 Tax=Flavobacterium collinsii TaxID=1114861 RepID=UPI001C2DB52A